VKLQERNIYYPDGTINEEKIHEAAQRHVEMLQESLLEKTTRELQTNLKIWLDKHSYYLAFQNLSACFIVAIDHVPPDFLEIASDNQAFWFYIEQANLFLKAKIVA